MVEQNDPIFYYKKTNYVFEQGTCDSQCFSPSRSFKVLSHSLGFNCGPRSSVIIWETGRSWSSDTPWNQIHMNFNVFTLKCHNFKLLNYHNFTRCIFWSSLIYRYYCWFKKNDVIEYSVWIKILRHTLTTVFRPSSPLNSSYLIT